VVVLAAAAAVVGGGGAAVGPGDDVVDLAPVEGDLAGVVVTDQVAHLHGGAGGAVEEPAAVPDVDDLGRRLEQGVSDGLCRSSSSSEVVT
jgi:hypothetical protein